MYNLQRLAGISLRTATGRAKEPGKIWCAILSIFPETMSVREASIIAKQELTIIVILEQGTGDAIVWIELRTRRRHGTTDPRRSAGAFRSQHIRLELQNWILIFIGGCPVWSATWGCKFERGGIMRGTIGPIPLVRIAIEIQIAILSEIQTARNQLIGIGREAGGIISVVIAIGACREVAYLGSEANVGL